MSNQVLQMKYHPAKKEVLFKRFQSGNEVPICNNSRLKTKYMNKKGKFVLQDFGNDFFNDIAYSSSGEKEIVMEVITTKGDFDDFMSMIEYYNENGKVKITAKLIAELPDMEKTYEEVKKHGLESMEILKKNRGEFYDIPLTTDEVKECVDSFAKEVLEATEDIDVKINRLEQNTVNICFSGVYSAGKSMLINSILGYSILPENIMPETAAMFRIKSPEKGGIRTVFDIKTDHSEIVWNDDESIFEFVAGPAENGCRKTIQDVINKNRDMPCYYQLRCILDTLNKETDVLRNIDVYYPIPLDSERVQFTIFDTPGTDSDDDEHQKILQDALSEQTHSILVFVVSPNNLKGGGNKTLLKYLSEAEKKENKSTIDLGRSLFVINMADMLTGETQFTKLKQADIEEEGIDPIKLSDKKLFFTSAKYGYASQAVKNGIASDQEEFTISAQSKVVTNEKFGCYYRYDQCATSELATNKLLSECSERLNSAMEDGNMGEAVWVASGLYALQKEIILYGIKYASAVKAYSIIDGVDKALARLEKNASSLKQQNDDSIERVELEIQRITKAVTGSIDNAHKKRALPKDGTLPESILKTLELNTESLSRFINDEGKERLKKVIKGFLGIFNKKWDVKDKKKVDTVIANVVDDYTKRFKENRKKLLETVRDEFIAEIKMAIEENGGLSDAAKEYISSIVPPEIEDFDPDNKFALIYDRCKKTVGFWIFEHEIIDKEKFLEKAGTELQEIATGLADDYKKKYREGLESLLSKVEEEFTGNMKTYNVMLRAKTKDKEAMEQLRAKIEATAEELKNCQDNLNSMIWREV